MILQPAKYTGRFAPSPTGDLHFGSLLAAMGSYCDARASNGNWLVRIDDIDPPRAQAGADLSILNTLKRYGFEWDQEPLYQSTRSDQYRDALQALSSINKLYACTCSRAKWADHKHYPGYCREKAPTLELKQLQQSDTRAPHSTVAVRMRLSGEYRFDDRLQGAQQRTTDKNIGDPVLLRRDKLFSYALACAIDDSDSISDVVRGADLLETTAIQIALMQALGRPVPRYAHLPVAINADGQKLSKQTLAKPIDSMPVMDTLNNAWLTLKQNPINVGSVQEFWNMAINSWDLSRVPSVHEMTPHSELAG